ncbi:hypothetical protein [uncultured Tolumonas sp.]|uniref:hypothetical protein n=1 Tax=uncultured Tolumonas sp. TaxID=263765 RepID=UPI00292E7AFA|nr:hypothetical protein [uncultured Tolumonas sp.]
MTNLEFVDCSCPHSWFLVADELHTQIEKIITHFGTGYISKINNEQDAAITLDSTNRTIFLLASFVLENLIKAYLVYENPEWISNGVLSKNLKSHKLTELANKSDLIPYKNKSIPILEVFQNGNESWARYPCSLNKDNTDNPLSLNIKIISDYKWLTRAYTKKLIKLLKQQWCGPHGWVGRYTFDGSFIGYHIAG